MGKKSRIKRLKPVREAVRKAVVVGAAAGGDNLMPFEIGSYRFEREIQKAVRQNPDGIIMFK
ncbi:hypothetical protein A2U01_0042476, partial [Trifolium medium]|nr:hypothetical protein [Trifolium medium]